MKTKSIHRNRPDGNDVASEPSGPAPNPKALILGSLIGGVLWVGLAVVFVVSRRVFER